MRIAELGEFGLIKTLAGVLPKAPAGIKGIGDDTAVLPYTKDQHLLLTTDMMAQDVHFTLKMDAAAIGHKALACNISDIAAMGGVPTYAVVSLGLPVTTPVAWVKRVYQGMAKTAKAFGVSVVGGDTIKSKQVMINVALLGEVKKTHLTLRCGAKPKDWVFVTGPLGGSLKSGRHLTFTTKVKQAQFLVKQFKPSAMLDISDGLAGDLNHLLKASQVGVKLWLDAIPLHAGVGIQEALADGEDYELVFTLNPKDAAQLMHQQFKQRMFDFFPIGEIVKDKSKLVHVNSYTHF